MSDDLIERLEAWAQDIQLGGDAQGADLDLKEAVARIRELEAAQGEGMYGEYTPITVRSDTAPATVAEALRQFVYETTHLSPEQADGSHWCKISKECLENGRTVLRAHALIEKGKTNEPEN